MTALLYLAGVVLFVLGLAVSIGLHELGHLVFGKLFGVRAPQYFVGFGRTVWSRRVGETEYGVKAFPLGGYVKLIGMLPPAKGDEPRTIRKSNTGMFAQLVSDARASEYELIEEGDEHRVFYKLPWWQKVIVMGAGATVNVVLAFLLFGGVFMVHGVPEPTTTIGRVSDCVVAIHVGQRVPKCTPADPVAPARRAGLRAGDRVVAFNGTRVTSYPQLQQLVRSNEAKQATVTVVRDGRRLVLHTTTTVNSLPSLQGDGSQTVRAGFLGITPTTQNVTKGAGYTVRTMGGYTWDTISALGHLPQKLWGVAKAAVGVAPRDPNSPMSVVGASRVAGQIASDSKVSVGDRISSAVMLLGAVNLFVGVFNFVPLLPLDGGHIAGALFEALRRGVARLRGRPDPGYFDVARLLPVAYVMAGLLLVMTLLLVYADIVVPV
ncbi:MAG TPA: site-2 protease family protein [Marmoricola sp.]|nr:site-2 protease family protein [Marmoricola sp.]